MTVFVAVAAIALVIQMGLLFGMYKSTRAMKETADRLTPKIESLLETSRVAIIESRTEIAAITAKTNQAITATNEILESAKKQMAQVEELVTDATARARIQMVRAEMVIDDTMNRAHETVAIVHGGIMKPLREIQGVAAGLHAALQYLSRGGRPDPAHATSDEEMFI